MLDISAISDIRSTVLWAMFGLGLLFGVFTHRTHFCTMGAISDALHFNNFIRLRMWFLAIGLSALGLQTMAIFGFAQLQNTLYFVPNWAWVSGMLGGFMFGIGMVLASGCTSKTLVRIGSGSLKALVVFIVLGISAYATLKGITAVLKHHITDPFVVHLNHAVNIPGLLASALGLKPTDPGWAAVHDRLAILFPVGLIMLTMASKRAWNHNVWIGAALVSLVTLCVWWLMFGLAYIHEHPETLEAAYLGTYTNRPEALSFVAPYAYTLEWLMLFSDENRVITTGIVCCIGMVLGAWLSNMAKGTFQWETFTDIEDTLNHILGAILMGVGGIMALGCSIGQGLSGVATLAVSSWLTLMAMVAGAAFAFRYQAWRIERWET